ncbi:MAG: 30S ribosomal protein S6 [Wolbachia endosymbiont of Xenopsylla cheopis]
MSQILAVDKIAKKCSYEFTFIANQSLVQNEVGGLIQELESILVKNEAELVKHEYWGLLDFAYLIDRMARGHYCMLNIFSSPSAMNEFERKVKLNEDIIRYLCIKVDKFHENDSFMIQTNNDGIEDV